MNWLKSNWNCENLPPSTQIGFRHLCPDDVMAVMALSNASFPIAYPERWFEGFCLNPRDDFCAIGCFSSDGTLVGYIVVVRDYFNFELVNRYSEFENHLAEEAEHRLSYVPSLAVDRRFQRLGIGTELMQLAIENCLNHPEMKPRIIFLHVHHENTPAQRMYARMGFQNRHLNPRYYYINKQEQAAFVFVKNLVDLPNSNVDETDALSISSNKTVM